MSKDYLKKNRNFIIILFSILLIIQSILFTYVKYYNKKTDNLIKNTEKIPIELSNTIINDSVRPQMRRDLQAIQEQWVSYSQFDKGSLLIKNENGFLLFKDNSNKDIAFDNNTMYKTLRTDKYYDIYDRSTRKIIKEKVKPQWNNARVEQTLKIFIAPLKEFGTNGSILAFDSNTGEIFYSSKNLNKTNILDNYISNPNMSKTVLEKHFLDKNNSDNTTKMVYLYKDSCSINNPNDFKAYPLGKYNREFQEKIILPYQTIGIDGQDMQITVVIGSSEKDIYSTYNNIFKSISDISNEYFNINIKTSLILISNLIISFLIIIIAIYGIKISSLK